jgi:hypothetical protein
MAGLNKWFCIPQYRREAEEMGVEFVALVLAQLHSVTYIHRCPRV